MAVIKKPIMAPTQLSPALRPKSGGKMRFPAPKNIEKSATPTMSERMGSRRGTVVERAAMAKSLH